MEPLAVSEISLEMLDAMPLVFGMGMAGGCIVVLAAGLAVAGFKALIHMIGR